jgi:hypothetical protein
MESAGTAQQPRSDNQRIGGRREKAQQGPGIEQQQADRHQAPHRVDIRQLAVGHRSQSEHHDITGHHPAHLGRGQPELTPDVGNRNIEHGPVENRQKDGKRHD